MKSFTLCLLVGVCVALTLAKNLPFRPTRTGSSRMPELFWVQNDRGVVVPALLHGIAPQPSSPRAIEDDVEFHLYNSKNPAAGSTLLTPGCATCFDNIVRGAKVVFLVHGFSSDHMGGFGDGLRDNFNQASVPEMNLIFVNWGRLAAAPWYETAANNVAPVGAYTGQLIASIVSSGAAPIADIVFAGHSLGSHVANAIAQNIGSLRLPVIHALDPALPLFGERDDTQRIDQSDAVFVNVIHSAAGTLLDGGLAFTEPRGHADFYPNTGKNQPGCGTDYFGACSHSRAHAYFGESVHHDAFVGCPCTSYEDFVNTCDCSSTTNMGWFTPSSARGIFHMTTRGTSPYGQG